VSIGPGTFDTTDPCPRVVSYFDRDCSLDILCHPAQLSHPHDIKLLGLPTVNLSPSFHHLLRGFNLAVGFCVAPRCLFCLVLAIWFDGTLCLLVVRFKKCRGCAGYRMRDLSEFSGAASGPALMAFQIQSSTEPHILPCIVEYVLLLRL
jgi:hypothetical protein